MLPTDPTYWFQISKQAPPNSTLGLLALGQLGIEARQYAPDLRERLEHSHGNEDELTQQALCWALPRLEPDCPKSFESLRSIILQEEQTETLTVQAIRGLELFPSFLSESAQLLIAAASRIESWESLRAVYIALGSLGLDSDPVIDCLEHGCLHDIPDVAIGAYWALSLFPDNHKARSRLLSALNHDNFETRQFSLLFLGRQAELSEEAFIGILDLAEQASDDDDWRMSGAVLKQHGYFTKNPISIIEKLSKDPEPRRLDIFLKLLFANDELAFGAH